MADDLGEIGRQHEELADALDDFCRQSIDFAHRHKVAETLRHLLMEMGMHFGFEEALMQGENYMDFDHHRRQHGALMTELGQLLDRVEVMDDPKAVVRRVDFIAGWYRRHVEHSDHLFDNWLAQRNLAATTTPDSAG